MPRRSSQTSAERRRIRTSEGQNVDRSWMKHIRCPFCGERICVNNYADRQVRLPKLKGVVMCNWCMGKSPEHWRGRNLAHLYKLLEKRADAGEEKARRIICKLMAVPPRRFREDAAGG